MTPSKSAVMFSATLLLAVFATGCQKDAAQEAEQAATEAPAEEAPAAEPAEAAKTAMPEAAPAPAPGTDAVVVEDRSNPNDAAPAFDAVAFEGRYAAGDTTLEVTNDGMFTLNAAGSTVTGTWTAKSDGKGVVLDPDSKSENDRQLEVVSRDSVKVDGTTLQRK